VYGDSLDPAQARAANLLGKLHTHYDEAGRLTITVYDFKGNVLEKARQVIRDDQILSVFAPAAKNNWVVQAFHVDWQPPAGMTMEDFAKSLLEPTAQETSLIYDALNRVTTMRYPAGVDGARKVLYPLYNRAGALESVKSDKTTYVEHIAYNAKGQRTLIAYGNGVMTRYAYDPHTFCLVRLRTERYGTPAGASLTYHPTTPTDPLQDFTYEYDLAGNILALHDRTPKSGLPAQPDLLDRAFTYDPLYRLLSATGRECDVPPPPPPWNDQPRCTDLTKVRSYTEQYQYDPVGNVQQLRHAATGESFTRAFSLSPQSNRLATLTIGATTYDYTYDASGNLTQETTSRHFEWDHSDRMRVYRTQVDGVEPSVHAHYLYDTSGQRVKKLVRKQGGQYEVTVYVDGIFEYQRIVQGGTTRENNTLHVMDNQQRITLVRVGTAFPDDKTPAIKYQLGDHLGSSNVVMDDTGAWIDREEYTPYGETSFGSFAKKRYRFAGKERDEESSLYYHGARYYAPWLGRWVSCDPAGMVDGTNLYQYARSNPLTFTDPAGTEVADPTDPASIKSVTVTQSGNVTGTTPPTAATPDHNSTPAAASSYANAPSQAPKVSNIATASDLARQWEWYQHKTESILNEWVENDPHLGGVITATAVKTSTDLGAGLVDLLKFGEGFAEGGWGIGKDILRGIGLAAPMLRVSQALQAGRVLGLSSEPFAVHQAKLLQSAGSVGRGELALVSHGAPGIVEVGRALQPVKDLAPLIEQAKAARVTIVACKVARDPAALQRLANAADVPVKAYTGGVVVDTAGQLMDSALGVLAKARLFKPQFFSSFLRLANKGSTVTGLAAGGLAIDKKQ